MIIFVPILTTFKSIKVLKAARILMKIGSSRKPNHPNKI